MIPLTALLHLDQIISSFMRLSPRAAMIDQQSFNLFLFFFLTDETVRMLEAVPTDSGMAVIVGAIIAVILAILAVVITMIIIVILVR